MHNIVDLEIENEKLVQERNSLKKLLDEAYEVIDSVKNKYIDAVFISDNQSEKILVTQIADHAYRNFVDNMSEGVVSIHEDGIILYSNPSFAKIVNLPLETIKGTNFRKFILEEFVNSFDAFITDAPGSDSQIALSISGANDIRSFFIVSMIKLYLHGFQVINLVMTDVTSQKRAEEKLVVLNENLRVAIEKQRISERNVVLLNAQLKDNIKTLEHANSELATFAYIASHDLQEPLRKIVTYTGLFMRDYDSCLDKRGRQYIQTIQASSERMRNLINDILDYSRLSHDLKFKPVDLDLLMQELLSDFEIIISETNASIVIEEAMPNIEANAVQIKQLFQNLLSNALKFNIPGRQPVISIKHRIIKGSEIESIVESRFDEMFCEFHFRDNGIGFNPVYSNKIFVIFQKLNNNLDFKGTGIGLAICKKVVEQHNGFIRAESNLGEGASFIVTLPVSQYREVVN